MKDVGMPKKPVIVATD